MPLDPHLAAVLQMAQSAGQKPIYAGTVQEGRDAYRQMTHGSRTPEQIVPVSRVEDTRVDGAAGALQARVYRPDASGPLPTVAYFHGGGWVIGDLDTHDNMCRDLCRAAQAVVVSVDYRLAPEHPFPSAAEDAIASTRAIAQRLDEFGGGPVLGVAGDSAGGNLSAVVTQQLRGAADVSLAAQFLIYPATDHPEASYPSVEENGKGYFLEQETMQWFLNHYIQNWGDTKDPRLAPMQAASLADLPPALVLVAEFDPLRDSGIAYARALQNAGNRCELIQAAGMLHGFFDMGRWSPAAQTIVQNSMQRFGRMLRGQ